MIVRKKRSKVINHGSSEYVEKIGEEVYRIPAGGSITLSRHDAVNLVGRYPGYNVKKPLTIEHILGSNDQTYVCATCGDEFATERDLLAHLKTHEEVEEKSVSERVYCCSECDFETTRKVALVGHMRTHKKDFADDPKPGTVKHSQPVV